MPSQWILLEKKGLFPLTGFQLNCSFSSEVFFFGARNERIAGSGTEVEAGGRNKLISMTARFQMAGTMVGGC